MNNIELEIGPDGSISMLHDDAVDIGQFGALDVTRASNVEFDWLHQEWYVESAATGKKLFWAKTRAGALAWEKQHYSPSGDGWNELTEAAS